MSNVTLFKHQIKALEDTKGKNRVAYYLDMGLGKTFVGSEKMKELGEDLNVIVCQKSKIDDWYEHIKTFYPNYNVIKYDKPQEIKPNTVIIINYDKLWRREELARLTNFTLVLDESSYIKNESSKRTKFILKMKAKNVILLSGTPTGGKYEELYSQCKLLGWKVNKKTFWDTYINYFELKLNGFKIKKITGYKNVDRLKRKLRDHGAVFMKTEDVFDLPDQLHYTVNVEKTKWYDMFKKDNLFIHEDEDIEFIGDTSLTRLLYMRKLCGVHNYNKLEKLKEMLESTEDRLIIFYNFKDECKAIETMCKQLQKPVSIVNGSIKDLKNYEDHSNSVTLVQYQAGAMGLNLQKANKIIYFSLPLSSELFEQSKKRTHRLNQTRTCFYYYILTDDSIELDILETLKERKDFTDELFKSRGY